MNFAIIVAAGKSERMGKGTNKAFIDVLNKPMIYYSLKEFQGCSLIDEIIAVTQKNNIARISEIKQKHNFDKIKKIIEGGKERQDSVYNGLVSINSAKNDDIVAVHNGSNPLVTGKEIAECISAAKKHGAAASGFPLKDTIKKAKDDFVERTIGRENIYQVQTPQAIKYGLFIEAFNNAKNKGIKVTDDVSLVEAIGKKVKIAPCSYENMKITVQDDLGIAEGILIKRNNSGLNFRIGLGHDSHKFSLNRNRKLVLGGCIIPHEIGLEANSDGDLVLHALFNAISSAVGCKSLGYYADPMLERGITDSKQYLKAVLDKPSQKNMKISNVSISIEAKKPRLDMYTGKIINSLSKILAIDKGRIGLTYTSGEGLTAFGRGEGMQCFVVVSLCIS
ncbi:2-C-methyl-D-erythritol 4-phosphate cytidylyltransferase [Candidatus Woesearchaeota archaeon]|nr:2-C-methyl-D-erythritol 4-phosphate cytidylyltransferase [Candidatus Woesearchaeota archaeon]